MTMTAAPHLTADLKRSLGAYYTPDKAVGLMARWILDRSPASILEPSFGDGAFLVAVQDEAVRRSQRPKLVGAELLPSAFEFATERLHLEIDGHAGDFLSLAPKPVDAVIGNPPFVRQRHLPASQRQVALSASSAAMGSGIDPSGSTWMSFVLHSTCFLAPGGSLALVLPLELTYVRYARPLWEFLGRSFKRVKVVRTYERMFPDLLQDVVVLLAEGRGGSTDQIEFQVTHELDSIDSREDVVKLRLDEVVSGDRAFVSALMPSEVRTLIADSLVPSTDAVGDLAKVRIGYVAGDKNYFHPTDAQAKRYRLPARSLRPTLSQARGLRAQGLFTGGLDEGAGQSLWLPDASRLTAGERRYIEHGESAEVDRRYKCSVRSPWFVVPGVEVPDLVVSVFSDNPLLMLNDGGYAASNSLLTATMKPDHRVQDLAAGWYSSVAQLFVELEVHSLGGGVLIAVPNELSKVRVPHIRGTKAHLQRLDRALRRGDYQGARDLGDSAIMKAGLLTPAQIADVKRGIATLQEWRKRPTRDR